MEHNGHTSLLVFFFTLLCVLCMVDPVKASIPKQARTRQIDLCAGAQWNLSKQEESPCPTLVVWVPKKTGFTEFVNISEHNEVKGGFSIAVFCYAINLLPYKVRPIFRPFVNKTGGMNGTYDDLLHHIEGQKCQAVAGDVTIRANRAQYVSFTIPYLSAEIYLLVHAAHEWNQTLGTFLKPFTPGLWFTLVCACILTGIAVALLEHSADNPMFARPYYKQLIMIIWFPISTIFFHEGKIHNKCSKVVLVMWLCMVFIVLQIFTATLSAWLTLDQLRPRLPSNQEKIGYQGGSFIRDLIIQKYKCSGAYLQALNSYEEFKNALADGSVDGIVDHLYYIDLFLAKYPSDYTKVGPIHREAGIAFALPIGSELLENFSRAVINTTESEFMTEMKSKYLGIPATYKYKSDQPHPQSLDVTCFVGLFTFMGIVTIAAIIFSEISLRHMDNKIGIHEVEEKCEECKEQVTTFQHVQIKIVS